MLTNGGFATVELVRTRRRPVAGAIAASVLLLAATACGSASDDSTGEALDASVESTVESTVDVAGTSASPTPGTDAPSGTTEVAPPAETSGGDPATTEAAVVVPEALQFTAPLVGGGTFDGAAVAGKPTVFWFWAPT